MSTLTGDTNDKTPLIRSLSPVQSKLSPRFLNKSSIRRIIALFIISGSLVLGLLGHHLISHGHHHIPSAEDLETCAWSTLQSKVSLLDVPPISRSEYLSRQATLAAALKEEGIDAYITEPSPSSLYYFNISTSFDLSERPFLAILSSNGSFSYLAPKFELGRIAGLDMVYEEKTVIEWKEEELPYTALKRKYGALNTKIVLDEQARFFIASGLQAANFTVVPMSQGIASIRAVKSSSELDILRGINEFTVNVVRSLQPCIQVGISQETLLSAATSLFTRAGVGLGFWAIILFGEGAANPHGGSKGKTLGDGEFALIDIGSELHGYGSDVTRTILPTKGSVSQELMDVWELVREAQRTAISLMSDGVACSAVDAASREVISNGSYGPYYTHRLGHGLGLEMHEHPYLNGANHELLKSGQVVTNEPGIYVTDSQAEKLGKAKGFGVRTEDPVLVGADGGLLMTGGGASSPWNP